MSVLMQLQHHADRAMTHGFGTMARGEFVRAIAIANAIVYVPLCLGNRPLADDLGHAVGGYTAWSIAGRPFAEWLFYVTNLGYPTVAAAWANHLLSLTFLVAAGTAAVSLFQVRAPVFAALASLPLTAHPYFLENFSYQFDGPSMAASLFVGMLAVHALPLPSTAAAIGCVACGVFAALALYQPGVNVLVCGMATFIAVASVREGVPRGLTLSIRAGIATLLGIAVYWVLIARNVDLVTARPSASMPLAEYFLQAFQRYWRTIWSDWSGNACGPAFAGLLGGGVCGLIAAWRRARGSVPALGVALAIVALTVCFQYGLLLLLNYPRQFPRSYVSFGVTMALLALVALEEAEIAGSLAAQRVIHALSMTVGVCLVIVSSAVGSAMSYQRWYETAMVTQISTDLKAFDTSVIRIEGVAPRCPVLKNTAKKFPVVPRVVANVLQNNSIWGHTFAQSILGLWWTRDTRPTRGPLSEPVVSRPVYRIYRDGDVAVVVF